MNVCQTYIFSDINTSNELILFICTLWFRALSEIDVFGPYTLFIGFQIFDLSVVKLNPEKRFGCRKFITICGHFLLRLKDYEQKSMRNQPERTKLTKLTAKIIHV